MSKSTQSLPILESTEDMARMPAVTVESITAGRGVKGSPRVELPDYKALMNTETREPFSVVGTGYVLQKHEDVLAEVEAVLGDFPDFGAWTREVSLPYEGAKMEAKYTFFETEYTIGDGKSGKGDLINPTVNVYNSYDLSWAKKLLFGAYRLICKNGLVIGEKFAMYRREHHQITDRLRMADVLRAGMEQFGDRAELWRSWVGRVTTSSEYEHAMDAVRFNRKETEEIGQEVEVSSDIRLDDIKTKTLTYWLFYNILMQYISHKVMSEKRRVELQTRAARAFG